MKIGVISLGCAKNLVDTENLLGLLIASNQEIVRDYDQADAIIINTCGFIESAKTEAIETILDTADLKERNLKKLIVMGCLSQRYKPQLEEEMPEVDRFIAIDEYRNLGVILSEVLGEKIANTYGKTPRVLSGKPWMAYLRIADGCDNKCSYCAIPLIRGPMRSADEDELVREAERLVEMGVKEINLIAQDSSRYGYDVDGKLHLSELLKRLNAIAGIHWIRILYLYPDEIPDDLIITMKECEHVLPYFDIPVQHGSDRILKAMNRRGSRKLILDRCRRIREELPDAVLRTTLICGFPGETEEDHQLNLSMIEEAGWDHLGAFTYSKEEGTPAYEKEDDVPMEVKQRRLEEVMMLQEKISAERLKENIGSVQEVMVEKYDQLTEMYIGRSALYAPDEVDGCVRFRSDGDYKPGDFVMVRITRSASHNLIGEEIG
ncbi:MAG: 30S ribosomal protein S12 methylthiotransferase RimO [Solobacterium sp.]|nr:30S ribosomal protein S12 methylthiotransferase RimO [Solobacterium sp.]